MIDKFKVSSSSQYVCSRCEGAIEGGSPYYGDPKSASKSEPWPIWCEVCQEKEPATVIDDGGKTIEQHQYECIDCGKTMRCGKLAAVCVPCYERHEDEKLAEAPTTDDDGGGPAFPVTFQGEHPGMSLLDWFAGMAMKQWVPARDFQVWALDPKNELHGLLSKGAYRIADAMLAERKKGAER